MKRTHLFAIVIAAAMTGLTACGGADLAPHVTIDGILALRPGMSYEEVVSKIGEPFEMTRELPEHEENGVMVIGREVPILETNEGHVVLIYFRRIKWATHYPMLWVHLRDGHVDEIYAKRHDFMDSTGIYGYSRREERWGSADTLRQVFPR
jgi:hypothetical protein